MPNNFLKWAWLPILLVFFAFAWPNLGYPSRPVFDEVYTAVAAQEFVEGRVPHEQSHPPLSKLIMTGGYLFWLGGRFQEATPAWSPIAFAIRSPSVLAGLASLILLYLLGMVLLEDRLKATLATGLLALDSMFLVMSRTAMTNIYGMCFTLLCALAATLAVRRRDPRWLLLSGLALGLGGACRWTAFVGGGLVVLLTLAFLVKREERATWPRWLAFGVLGALVLPPLVYLATYFPQVWIATHHNLAMVFSGHTVDYLIRVHRFAVAMHTKLIAPSSEYSPWYTWPLMLRPVWFYIEIPRPDAFRGIWGIGNGLVWWATLPALAYGLFQGLVRKRAVLLAPTVMALGLWLVWAPARSPINYLHYMFEAVPFVCLLVADALVTAWQVAGVPRLALRLTAVAYVGLAVAWAVWFYPLLTAQQVDLAFYRQHFLLGPDNWDVGVRLTNWRKQEGLESDEAYKAFLKHWFPTPESYLEYLKSVDTINRLRKSPQPPPSPAQR